MIQVTGVFRTHQTKRTFKSVYDAIEYRDYLDANYAEKIIWEEI